MSNSNFYIVGKHPVIEALKNPNRKVIRLFLTEESKKTIHRENNKINLIKDIKVYFKTKKELLNGGGGRIRTFEDRSQRVYSPPHLTALVPLPNSRGSVPLFNKALNNMRFIYFYCTNAIREI